MRYGKRVDVGYATITTTTNERNIYKGLNTNVYKGQMPSQIKMKSEYEFVKEEERERILKIFEEWFDKVRTHFESDSFQAELLRTSKKEFIDYVKNGK